MLQRFVKISTVLLSTICCFFVLFTGVFAATKQSTTISTTVQFTPGILAVVEAKVDSGNWMTIFDNITSSPLNHTTFAITPNLPSTELYSPNQITFRITNHTEKHNVSVSVSMADYAPTGISLQPVDENLTSITTPTIPAHTSSTPQSAETNPFHIISIFQNAPAHLIINISATDQE